VTHFLACLWLFIPRVDPQQDLTWFKLVQYDIYADRVTELQKYVDSAFFVVSSMTGLGFAYIYPRTRIEYAV
jgi:CRP-like cAMP-binding protein